MLSRNQISKNIFTGEQERELCQTPKSVWSFILPNAERIGKILDIPSLHILVLRALNDDDNNVNDSWRDEFAAAIKDKEGLINKVVLSMQNYIRAKYFSSGGSNILRAAEHRIEDVNLITTKEGVMSAYTIALLEKLFVKKNFLHDGQIPFMSWVGAKTPEERNTITDLLTYDTVGKQGHDPLGQDKDWEPDMYFAIRDEANGQMQYKLKPQPDGHLIATRYEANRIQ